MATAAASISLNVDTGLIVVTDTTDYTGQGLVKANCRGYISVYGVALYDNIGGVTPDITPATSLVNTSTINLPVDSDGNALNGDYILTYVIVDSSNDPSVSYTFAKTFTLDYTPPEISIEQEVDCVNSRFISTDTTVYGTASKTRTHLIQTPPIGPAPPPYTKLVNQTTSGNINTYTGITTGWWTSSVVSVMTVTFASDFTLVQSIAGTEGQDVTCNTDVCKIACCLYDLRAQQDALYLKQGANNPYYQTLANKLQTATDLFVYFLIADRCGNTTKQAEYVAAIKAVTGCDDTCSCSQGQVIPIIPSAGSTSTFDVDSPDTSIDVVTEIVGNLTTFHIQVSDSIQNIINNYNGSIVTSTDGSVDITTTTVGTTKTYDLSVPASSLSSNRMYVRGMISRNPNYATPGQAQYLFTPVEVQNTGTLFQTPTYGLGATVPNTLSDYITLGVSDFYASSASYVPFTAQANMMKSTVGDNFAEVVDLDAEIYTFSASTDTFTIRLWNPSKAGQPARFSDLIGKPDIYLQISLHASP